MWEKRMVYVVTIWLKEEDEEGEPINWSSPSEEYFADTLEEAEQMRERFLSGEDKFYGDLIEDCWISDEREEREFLVPPKKPSVVDKLQKAKETAAGQSATVHAKEVQHQNEYRGGTQDGIKIDTHSR